MIAPLSYHWHVLGAGAIGCLMASHLFRNKRPVTLITRDSAATEKFSNGLQLLQNDQKTRLPLPCVELAQVDQIQALLITTKANDVVSAYRSIAAQLHSDAPVVLMHNGLGIYEQLQTEYPAAKLCCGTTTEAAYFNPDHELVYAGQGQTTIGQPGQGQPPAWYKELATGLYATSW
jgi:2-dehydropantoate 2-reductase